MPFRTVWMILREVFQELLEHDILTQAAGIAFYTALGLAPTVLIFLSVASSLGGVGEQSLVNEIRELVGDEAAEGVELVIENANRENRRQAGNVFSSVVGIATFLFSASGIFAQLQYALNMVWNVMPRPDAGVADWLRKRLISLGMVLGMLVLMLASLVTSTAVSMIISGSEPVWRFLNVLASLVVFTISFALIFKFLPDVKITWRDVTAGALMTALLFSLGKWAIGLYLGNSAVGSSYGVAGSLIVLLLWVYYSSIIILVGAEITQVYARRLGSGIHPDKHAVRVTRPTVALEEPSQARE